MIDDLIFNDSLHGEMIAAEAGTTYHPLFDTCIMRVDENGEPLGGVMYSDYTGESCAMHSASWRRNWISRGLLWVSFDYPFRQMKVNRIFGQVPETNRKALKFNLNIGFKIIKRISGVYPDNVDCMLMKLERNECRFLTDSPKELRNARYSAGNLCRVA